MKSLFTTLFLITLFQLKAQVVIDNYLGDFNLSENQTSSTYLVVENQKDEAITCHLRIPPVYGSYFPYNSPVLSLSIPAQSADSFQIDMLSSHNLDFDSYLFVEVNDEYAVPVEVNAQLRYSNNYYSSTFNKREEALKQSLKTLISGHSSLGYNSARDAMFMNIDNKRNNGQGATQNTLECPYTGRQAIAYSNRQDAQNNYSFNTEHTYPQGLFSRNEPMKSDMFHLYPTDQNSNSQRGNLAFGVVSSASWSEGGSKKGNGVFEPRDAHKGAAARSMMYFVTRYLDYSNFFRGQETILRQWNSNFPPSQAEQRRNDDIESYQGNRNPFIDYPQFADRIASFTTNSVNPDLVSYDFYPERIQVDTIDDRDSLLVYLYNSGDTLIELSNILFTSVNGEWELSSNKTQVSPKEYAELIIRPLSNGYSEDSILVNTSPVENPQTYISLRAFVKSDPNAIQKDLMNIAKIFYDGDKLVYPDPLEPRRILDLKGKEINTSFSNIRNLASGLYVAEFNANKQILRYRFVKP